MAWWDSRRHRASAPSWSAPSPMRKKESGGMDGILGAERQLPVMIDGLSVGVLSRIVEEENVPFLNPPLVVNVSIRFMDPIIRSQYGRSYASSRSFVATDRICKGLLRRIEHCCEEFITRKDSGALSMFAGDTGAPKRQRYEMTFRIIRRESGQWAERTFRSYQKQPLTVGFTKEVILASQRMVGLFLRCHDQGFRWLDGSVLENYQGPDTVTPSVYGPLSPCCIPRSRFDESSQSFEFIPGYTIMLSFRSRTKRPSRTQFGKVVRINSEQNAPLNLYLAEELLWQVLQSVQTSLDAKKLEFDDEHQQCEGFDGTEGTTACPHLDDDAVHIDLRISNNIGPSYDHLQRQFRSKLTIFRDDNLQDCLDFIRHLENDMMDARDQVDDKINLMNDFELRLLEVRSPTWSIHEPVKVCIGPSASHSRRTIEAVLDRVQTGISDVLRGNNLSAHVAAYKRGHLVLDKALVARQGSSQSKKQDMSAGQQREDLVARLKTRIQQDIDKVCKDTCSLDGIPKDDAPIEATPTGIDQYHAMEERPADLLSATPTTGETTQGTTDIRPQTPVRAFSLTGRRISPQESLPETNIDVEHQRPMSRPSTPTTPTGSIRSSYTGTGSPRAFPLVPARYSMASRSSSASTLATDLFNVISSEPPLDNHFTGKDTIDSLILETLHGVQQVSTKESTAAIVADPVSAPEDVTSETVRNDVALEQPSAHIDNVSEPDPSLEDGLPVTNTQQFELGPPINLVREADLPSNHLRHVSRDWDSFSYGTTDDDEDSGAVLYERPHGDEENDFAKSKMDITETSHPLPMDGHTGNNQETRDDIRIQNSEDDCADERRNHENEHGRYTAPSTPALSSGCDSSPRHSILMTSTIQRTHALVKSRILEYVQETPSLETKDDDCQGPKDTPLDLGDVDSGVNEQHPSAVSEIDVDDEDRPSANRQGIALEDEDEARSDASYVHVEEQGLPLGEAEQVRGGQQDTVSDMGDDVNDNDEHPLHPDETVLDRAGVAVPDESVALANLEIVEPAMMELPPSPPASPEMSATEGALLKDEVAEMTNEQDNPLDAADLSDQDEPSIEAGEGIAVDQGEAAHHTFVPEVEIQDPASIQLPPSPEIRASEAIVELEAPVDEERAAVSDAIVDSSNLEVIEPVSVHLSPSTPLSPQISATERALLEVEDAEVKAEVDTHVDIGHSFSNEAISSEDGHVMVDDQESQQGSLPSDNNLRDPAAIELPLSPEIQANEGYVTLNASELDCELHTSPVEEEDESTDIEVRHDNLEQSDEAALEEVNGCEIQPTVLLLDLNQPTSTAETQADPNPSELDSQEVQEVEDNTLDTVMTEELENSTLVTVTDMNTSQTVPTQEPEPANTEASEWVVIPEAEVLGGHQDVEPNDQEAEHPAEAPVAKVEVVDSMRERDPQTPTAESFPSYLTAQEISNPYDDLPTEFDSMATPKALPSENRNMFWTRSDIPAPIRSNTAIFAPINPSPILSPSRGSFETTSSYTSSAPSVAHERDSVDTYAPSTISDLPEPEPEREYRPQTAGFLGLRRPDNVPRRFSMPLQHLWESGAGSDTTSRPGTAGSTGTVKVSRRRRRKDMSRSMSSGAVLTPVENMDEKTGEIEGDDGRRRFFPRAVMIFAGMAFASKILNGDGD